MRKVYIFIFCLINFPAFSQSWSVFNNTYRYNYKFNGSSVISNVLFSTSYTASGSDTVFNLNLIGAPCVNGCPTLTASVGSSTLVIPKSRLIVPNQPQFLQRKIKKFTNGIAFLYDTAKFVINTQCSQSQSWLFDSINNINVTCIAIGTKTIFAITDSVKTLLLATGDTILLSKQFGIIQFPLMYGQNKYYRLVGIEKKSAYEINALYGQKVPNFWEFYNYNVGNEFYTTINTCDKMNSSWTPLTFYMKNEKSKILNKQVGSNSITYTIQSSYQMVYLTNQGSCGALAGSVTNTTGVITYSNTSNLFENYLYPGSIFDVFNLSANPVSNTFGTYNICAFINDTKSKFTKRAGFYCSQYNPPNNDTVVAFKYVPTYSVLVPANYYNPTFGFTPMEINQKIFTVGLGVVRDEYVIFEHDKLFCLRSAVIGTDTILGPMPGWNLGVGVNGHTETIMPISLYPNPANDYIMINSSQTNAVEVYDAFGKKLSVDINSVSNGKLPTDRWVEGVYFIRQISDAETKTDKVVIQHN